MMRKLILYIILVVPAFSTMAQGSRQALLADSLYRYSSYAKAVKHYEKALSKENSPDLFIGLGNSYYRLQQYEDAIRAYERAEDNVTSWTVRDKLNYIQSQRATGNENEVERLLDQWNNLPQEDQELISSSFRAMDIFFMDSAVYEVHSMESVNTENAEFSPVYFKEGLLFASSRGEGNVSSRKYHWNNEHYLDLYYASSVDNEAATFETNSKFHDGPVSFFNNESKVIFTRNEKAKNKKDQRQLALYEADVSPEGRWENIKPLSLNNPSYSVSHPAITEDGNVLYFVSNREGGYGGTDIYRSVRQGSGWSEPENLGAEINSPGNEMFPVLFREELFFASDGHPGMGGLDMFAAEKVGRDTYFIRNLGAPLNSTWDDFGLITRNGKDGYFSSNRTGDDDVYSFVKGKIVVEITYVDDQGKVLDSVATMLHGKKMFSNLEGNITRVYLDRESVNDLQASRSSFADTAYQITTNDEFFISRTIPLRPLTDEINRGVVDLYPVAVNEEGYDLFLGKELRLMKADPGEQWRNNFVIKKVPEGLQEDKIENVKGLLEGNGYTVRIHEKIERIHFDFDKWNIRPSEHEKLNRLADLLNTYDQTQVVIGAHADERGSERYNMKLSAKRAQSTVDYLISRGVKSDKMTTHAYGESMLLIICSGCSEEEHQQNRRVTFEVTLED